MGDGSLKAGGAKIMKANTKKGRRIPDPPDGKRFLLRGEDGELKSVWYRQWADAFEDSDGGLYICGLSNVLPAEYEDIHIPNAEVRRAAETVGQPENHNPQ